MRTLSGLLEKARLEEKGKDEGEPRTVFDGNFVGNSMSKCACLFVV